MGRRCWNQLPNARPLSRTLGRAYLIALSRPGRRRVEGPLTKGCSLWHDRSKVTLLVSAKKPAHWNALLPLITFAPLLATAAIVAAPLGVPAALGYLSGGLFLWTLLEYVVHRFAHESRFSVGKDGRRPHLGHHARPTDLSVMVTPLSFTLPVTLALWAGLRLALGAWPPASALLFGILVGYGAYEGIHYRIHSASIRGPLLRRLRDHHLHHHFRNASSHFGVTTPFWDIIFRSRAT